MKTKSLLLAAGVALVSCAFIHTSAADTKIEQALRNLDAQWSAAAGAKDLDKTVSYYGEGAIAMPPNAPSLTIKDAIRSFWKDLLASPGLVISWKTTKIEVAQSGDIGYSSGTWELTANDASGKAAPDHGKYLEVWKKQTDGTWKCVMDIWNSDVPSPAEKK